MHVGPHNVHRPRRGHSPSLYACVWQLLSGTYAVAPRSLHCGGFGLLCACGALIGLAAAHTCSRPVLYLVRHPPSRPRRPFHAHRRSPTPKRLWAWAACALLVTSKPTPTQP